VSPDKGTDKPGSGDDGCSCRVGDAAPSDLALPLLFGLALGLIGLDRRRRVRG